MPAFGALSAITQAKPPDTEPNPPVRVESANVWPYVMDVAVGTVRIVGVTLFTVTLTGAINML